MSYGTVAPTHAIKASELESRARFFLAEQNKNRLTLEATDDLGTLIVDPMSGNVRSGGKIGAQPSASAHPPTRRRWTVTGPGPRLFSEGLWRQHSKIGPSGSQPAATILQTESSRRSTTTDEKCHLRPHHRSAA